MLATVLPVAVFMLILYRLWSVYDPMEFREHLVRVRKACKGDWPCWH